MKVFRSLLVSNFVHFVGKNMYAYMYKFKKLQCSFDRYLFVLGRTLQFVGKLNENFDLLHPTQNFFFLQLTEEEKIKLTVQKESC